MMDDVGRPFRQIAELLMQHLMRERRSGRMRLDSYSVQLAESAISCTVETMRDDPNLSDEDLALRMKRLLQVEMALDKSEDNLR